MEILKNIQVPTGNIMIVKGDKGRLFCVNDTSELISELESV